MSQVSNRRDSNPWVEDPARASSLRGLRRAVFPLINPGAQPLPANIGTAYVWPTELCSVGCSHCNFASSASGTEPRRKLATEPQRLVDWLAAVGCDQVVACGGGEPLEEPDFLTETITKSTRLGMRYSIYTSGTSVDKAPDVRALLRDWNNRWLANRVVDDSPHVRLSVDAFHEEKIGLDPVIAWINAVEKESPDWKLSLRGVRLANDHSLSRLATALGAELIYTHPGLAHLTLPSGRRVKAELKGFVFDGRASLRTLARRGLALHSGDAQIIAELVKVHGTAKPLGRPLSSRLTVTSKRIDLEIHADGDVHVLESQPKDTVLNLFACAGKTILGLYYRDPILHRVVGWGLPAIAELLGTLYEAGLIDCKTIPNSVDHLDDAFTLDAITAMSIALNAPRFSYPPSVTALVQDFWDRYPQVSSVLEQAIAPGAGC